jgi:hypothetical protein
MRKLLIIYLLILSSISCQTSRKQQIEVSPAKVETEQIPKTETPELTKKQSKKLDESIPPRAREILQTTQVFEIYGGEDLRFQQPTEHIRISDKNLMKELLKSLYYDVATSDGGAGCYTPRHRLTANFETESVSLEICFECSNIRGSVSGKSFYTSVNDKFSKEIFNQILQKAEKVQ